MSRPLAAALIAVAFFSAGCRKEVKPVGDIVVDKPPSVDTRLQVATIQPGQVSENTEIDAEIYGSGFQQGARVGFSGGAVANGRFLDQNTLQVRVPALPSGSYDVTVTNPDGTQATLRRGLTVVGSTVARPPACAPVTVRFAFDSFALDDASRAALDTAATCLRDQTIDVRIEGHTDATGTTDYNMALGQRRADAVVRYLQGIGVSPTRLRGVSYGEERPTDPSSTDQAHATNRRADVAGGTP
jgi:outer membrane protein OmpA-like peptidoglycan-associated protein